MDDVDGRDERMMGLALELADRAAAMDEVPVGAVVYRGDEVLGVGHNRRETDADPTAHAEMLALREAAGKVGSWRLDGCEMAVTLEPCPMCAGALVNSRVDRVVYGCTDPKMGAVDTLYEICTDVRLNHRLVARGGVMGERCAEVLREFFRGKRKGGNAE